MKTRRRFFSRNKLFPFAALFSILATLILPVFIFTAQTRAAAPPTNINMLPFAIRGDLGNFGPPEGGQYPYATCYPKFDVLTRSQEVLVKYFAANAGANPNDITSTYIGTRNANTITPGQISYVADPAFIGKDDIPVIRFLRSESTGTDPINGEYRPDTADNLCEELLMLPVSQNEWRGYQVDRINGNEANPTLFMTFTADAGESPGPGIIDQTTGKLDLYYANPTTGYAALTRTSTPFSITVQGDPEFNKSGGSTNAGTLVADWHDASELEITSGELAGEVYTMRRWQQIQGKSYYFLTSVPEGSTRASLTRENDRICENDAGPQNPGCLNGAANCVPFIEVDAAINFSRTDPSSFNARVQGLGGANSRLYDYNNTTECRQHRFFNVNKNSAQPFGQLWFYYSKSNDSFITVFASGDPNEQIYLGTYTKDPSGLYVGGSVGCDGHIALPGGAGSLDSDVIEVEWRLRNTYNGNSCAAASTVATAAPIFARGGAVGETKFEELSGRVGDIGDVGGDGRVSDIVCDLSVNPLTWLMCPIISTAQYAIEQLDNLINRLLTIDVNQYFNETCTGQQNCSGAGFFTAWNNIRILAIALIVIAALVMVISQAAGLELLDAYTLKKILPRLIIAGIAIPISWEAAKAAINLSEVIGLGVRNIIYSPFAGQGSVHIGGGTSSALALVGGAGLLTLGLFGMLSFILTALLSTLIAAGVLILREVVIIFVVILSPLIIAAFILPNTQKAGKFGLDAFTKMLAMFPLIMAATATGRVFSFVSYEGSRTDDSLLFQLIALIAYFAPYFLIPATFRLAGGIIATVGGFVNDRSRGAFDRLRQFRGNRAQENVRKMATGDRFRGSNAMARAFNTTTQGVASGWAGRFGLGRRGAAMRDNQGRSAAEAAAKSERMQALQYDDDAIAAMYLSAGQSSRRATRELTRLHTDAAGNWESGWSAQRVARAVAQAEYVGINKSNAMAAGNLGGDNKFRSLGFGQQASDAIAATNAVIAGGALDNAGNFVGGNRQLFDNLEGGIRWHARTHGATHVAAGNLADSWDRTSMGELNGSSPGAKAAFLEDLVGNPATGRVGRLNYVDPDGDLTRQAAVRQRAAVQMLEMHTLLSHGTDAGSQAALVEAEERIGFNDAAREAISFEGFLAARLGVGGANGGAVIRSKARTYDGQTEADLARMSRMPGS